MQSLEMETLDFAHFGRNDIKQWRVRPSIV